MTTLKSKLKIRVKFMAGCLFAICLILGFTQCNNPDLDNGRNAKSVIAKSNFIFLGTIVRMDASNIDVKTNGPTAIVLVDEVIEAASPYDQMKGKEITVLLAPNQERKAGEKEVFYTVGWYYGKTLGVKEIPNKLNTEIKSGFKERIAKERMNLQNDSLRVELRRSTLVVQGLVVESGIRDEKIQPMESEHDPAFRKAIIEIKAVLKGDFSEKQVAVYYASSDDVMWSDAPKLVKGQEGIFLLHKGQAPAIFKMRDYTLLKKRDIQSDENLENVRSLIKQ